MVHHESPGKKFDEKLDFYIKQDWLQMVSGYGSTYKKLLHLS